MLWLFVLFVAQFPLLSWSIVSQILNPVSIFEESPISTIVVDLRPTFQQLNVHPDQAVLLQSQPSQPFEYLNGRIQLKSRLDREDYVRKRLCLGGNVLECNFTLTLTVHLTQPPFNYILSQPITCHDINDMIPKFSQSESLISTAENVPVGHRIPLEIAVDLDSPPYGIDHYRLVTSTDEDQEQFSIVYDHQSRELELIVNEKLDREQIDRYLLKLLAVDRGHTPNIGVQYLTIEISDINDSPPKFASPIYNVTIAENTLPEYLVKLVATDEDIGMNAELTFSLENDHQRLFHLDSSTGVLTLTHALDFEFHSSYQLKAQVQDHGLNPFTDTCLINIYVIDQNDHAPSIQMKFNPIFESNLDGTMAYVAESFDIQLPIGFVNVYDQDSAENGKSQLTIEPNRLFYLEILRPNYYSIKSQRRFDRESTSIYQIELRARDFGQPILRRSMTFQLNITDINDEKPLFQSNYTFEIYENNQIPSVIGQVKADDNDLGFNSQILYSIVSPSSPFFISPIDGILSTNISFDYESQRKYFVQIRARDSGQPPLESISIVQINILDQNEFPPKFEKEIYSFSLDENSTEQCFGRVKAIDRDFNDRIEYQLENHQNLFNIDQKGNLCTTVIFDREIQDQYNITVIAKDNTMMGSTFVQIKINDVNDNAPIFIWPDSNEIRHVLSMDHSQRIDSSHPSAQLITDLVVRDDDIGNNSFVRLSLSNTEYFYIGSNHSLWLKNNSILPGTYEIEVYADNLQFRTKKIYQILIFDRHALKLNLFQNMSGMFSRFSLLIIVIISFLATGSTVFLLIYYLWIRLHYPENVPKRFDGNRLIVNDEDKSKGTSSDNHDYAMIIKPKKTGPSLPSANSSSTTTDGDFSSSILSSPINDFNVPTVSTVSALTTLTRKSQRRPTPATTTTTTKSVTFQPNLFDDFFSNHSSSCDHDPPTISSTFSTLPKSVKRDIKDDFPTLDTILHSSNNSLPQPPPLLDGIRLLDQMLNKTNLDDRTSTSSNSHSGWYNVTSPYQTRASVV